MQHFKNNAEHRITKFAVDLTWVRHGIVGGTESFACNLLDGFAELLQKRPGSARIVLLTASDNSDVFRKYHTPQTGMRCVVCNTPSMDRKQRLLWQNVKLQRTLNKLEIDILLEPIYAKPFLGTSGIRCVTVIHDLQAWHFPEYFSKARVQWMKCCWRNTVKTSDAVVVTSSYTAQDVENRIPGYGEKIHTIPIPIMIRTEESGAADILTRCHIQPKEYYYTVSSQVPHKNLATLLRAMGVLKKQHSKALYPLIITGVGDDVSGELQQIMQEEELEDIVRFTGFIPESERNTLYKHCRAFVFPSIFEGFGMPPLEAMAMQVPVLTTECASIKEVTGGLVNYVKDPKDPKEWAQMLEQDLKLPKQTDVEELLQNYEKMRVAEQYLQLIQETAQ